MSTTDEALKAAAADILDKWQDNGGTGPAAQLARNAILLANATPDLLKQLERARRPPKHYVANSWFIGDYVVTFAGGKLEWRKQHTFSLCQMSGVVVREDKPTAESQGSEE